MTSSAPEAPARAPWPSAAEQVRWLAAIGVLAAVWAPRLSQSFYSVDDYILLQFPVRVEQFFQQGRFGQAALWWGMTALGLSPPHAVTALAALSVALLGLSGVLLLRLWRMEGSNWLLVPLCVLPFAHPYAAEIWSFRIAPVFYAIALVSALGALTLARERGLGPAPVGLVVFSLSVYQLGFNPAVVVIGMGLLLDILRGRGSADELKDAVRGWWGPLAALLGGTVAYLVLNAVLQRLAHTAPDARGAFLPLGDLLVRAREVRALLAQVFFTDRHLSTQALSSLLLALLGLAVLAGLRRAAANRSAWQLLLVPALLAGCALSVVGLMLALKVWWPMPRTLTGIGFFWAGVFALLDANGSAAARRVVAATACLVVVCFAGLCARVTSDQARLNAVDRATASRVVGRFEASAAFPQLRTALFVNGAVTYQILDTQVGDLNLSALGCTWSQAEILGELLGRPLPNPSDDERARGTAFCTKAAKWPAEGSTAILDGVGVVCF